MIPHSRPDLGPEEASAAARVVRSGMVAQGRETAAFEKETAAFLGVRGAVAVSSGTAALTLALRALDIKPSEEVLLPAFACSAVLNACRLAGARPALADVNAHDFNLSAADAEKRLTRRTAAILAVHGFGAPADLEPFLESGLPVVEDLAQALGGRDARGRRLGTQGRAGILSFYATKLMTTGEGGMLVSNDAKLLARARDLRDYDEKPAREARFNFKMTDIQAAVGRVQLRRLPRLLAARAAWAARYREALAGTSCELPLNVPGRAWHRFIVRPAGGAARALRRLEGRGVAARRPVFRPLCWDFPSKGRFPETERAWKEAVSLPLYPSLTEKEFQTVVRAARAAFK